MSDSHFFKTLAIVVPVTTAGLYLLGLTYHEGFLAAYGIEPSLFPLASEIALLQGFFVFAPAAFSLKPVLYAVIAMFGVLFMAVIAYVLASNSRVQAIQIRFFSRKLRIDKKNPEIKQKIGDFVEKSEAIYQYFIGAFLIFLVTILVAGFAYKSGTELAVISLEKFNDNESKWVMLHFSNADSPKRAQQIICNTTHCAFWLGNEALILAHDKIEKVVAHKASAKKVESK